MRHQRRARGRAKLARLGALRSQKAGPNRLALQQKRRGGGGHRQHTVRAAHASTAQRNGRRHHRVGRQQLQQHAHRRHVGHGIQRAHLVQMHLLHRHAMHAALGARDGRIHGFRVFFGRFGHGQPVDARSNRLQRSMRVFVGVGSIRMGVRGMDMLPKGVFFMMRVAVRVRFAFLPGASVFLPAFVGVRVRFAFLASVRMHRHFARALFGQLGAAVHMHVHMGAAHAAALGLARVQMNAKRFQRLHRLPKGFALRRAAQLIQRRAQHVARRAHVAFQIQYVHFFPLWLILLAR